MAGEGRLAGTGGTRGRGVRQKGAPGHPTNPPSPLPPTHPAFHHPALLEPGAAEAAFDVLRGVAADQGVTLVTAAARETGALGAYLV